MTDNNYSLSDIRAVTGNNDNGFGFGGNGAWWLLVLFLFVFAGGWGGRGMFGNGGGTTGGVADGYVLASDMSRIQSTITQGLCDGFYSTAQLINGTNQNMANGFANAELSRANQQAALTNQIFGLQTAQAQCCCDYKAGIADLKYAIASGDCATGQAIANSTRDIIDNQNANYRALHDEIVANRIEDKNAQIQAQNQQIFQLQLAASQAAQNNFLVNALNPNPIPAFTVPNPYAARSCGCNC